MLEVGLITFAALCMAIKTLRLHAALALAVLAAIHPFFAVALAALAGLIFLVTRSNLFKGDSNA
jgi:hypothetical protein